MIKCDPRAKARCPFKEPCCGDEIGYFLEGSDCDKFNQKVCAPPPTNADHIRAMSDEELAITIMCPNEMGMAEMPCDHSDDKSCYECLLKWLQQPAEEATDDANE